MAFNSFQQPDPAAQDGLGISLDANTDHLSIFNHIKLPWFSLSPCRTVQALAGGISAPISKQSRHTLTQHSHLRRPSSNSHASPRSPILSSPVSRLVSATRNTARHRLHLVTDHCPHHEKVPPKRLTGLRPSFKEVVKELAPEAEVVPPSVVHGINIWKRVLVQGAKARARPDGNFKRLFRSRLSALDWALNVVGGLDPVQGIAPFVLEMPPMISQSCGTLL
ncbi:hypothetical protein BDP55DRAFT_757320 [Colletotrichum godetiae]|uniref:Uncharacterized protein n=1 Tax=Colletotrichum godetiae TaxID=1209918 RepID=A0AAJ0EPT0_9PEZI|nr:uncharacterized protein BDP55DRAFT_757320 [Colletotrichum godetiae]KAK1658877.1 hypothetical protein BDP55DRAFT_757320 [Colletotrichum godetiae]